MSREVSALERARAAYKPTLPDILSGGIKNLRIEEGRSTSAVADAETIRRHFPRTFGRPIIKFVKGKGVKVSRPLNVGVVLSGGQAPGGHNVIAGLFDGIKALHPGSRLFGFLGGPKGICCGKYKELTAEQIEPYRNTGGFDIIGSGRFYIEKKHLAACKDTCESMRLNSLVIIGGDDSNTNAAGLAEYFLNEGVDVSVIGVPKTIDGDLRNEEVEIPFGFDTASKLYSELIGNICRDAKSARKYWHFIKLMGRSASHITLECALQTHPNIALIGEEMDEKKMTLALIVEHIAGVVKRRSEAKKNFGVCLVPEGLIEFIPEFNILIKELNAILVEHKKYFETIKLFTDQQEFINAKLTKDSSYVFSSLPSHIQRQLLIERGPFGEVLVSRIETEKLLIEQVGELLAEWKAEGKFSGKFSTQSHFLGYEGRCAAPSNFDVNYSYALGYTATAFIAFRQTGYICSVSNLLASPERWLPGGVPITSLMNIERRKGKPTPVIKKALVRIDGEPFKAFATERERWEIGDDYVYPGAIQYFGPPEVHDTPTKTLILEHKK